MKYLVLISVLLSSVAFAQDANDWLQLETIQQQQRQLIYQQQEQQLQQLYQQNQY